MTGLWGFGVFGADGEDSNFASSPNYARLGTHDELYSNSPLSFLFPPSVTICKMIMYFIALQPFIAMH